MNNIKIYESSMVSYGCFNDYKYKKGNIEQIIKKLELSNVDIIEVGKIENQSYNIDRCIYNDLFQIIINKKKDINYSVRIDEKSIFLLDEIPEHTEKTIDMITISVDVLNIDKIKFILEKIIEKGYLINILLKNIVSFKEQYLINMLIKLKHMNINAIILYDTVGDYNLNDIKYFCNVFDKYIDNKIALGYYNNNAVNGINDICKYLMDFFCSRNIIFYSSILGKNQFSGMLSTEYICDFLNKKRNQKYDIKELFWIFDNILIKYNSIVNYYSLSNIWSVNPKYIWYYIEKLNVSLTEMYYVFCDFEDDKKDFSEEKAEYYLYKYRKNFWKKKLCIIIPTCNRLNNIKAYIEREAFNYKKIGIDLIIYDSSDNDIIKEFILDWNKDNSTNIIYYRYDGNFDGMSIDEKIIDSYKTYKDYYEYIWVCRDGYIIDLMADYKKLYLNIINKYDLLVIYNNLQDYEKIGDKEYLQQDIFFLDNCRHMAILGTTVVSSDFIKKVIENIGIDKETNYGLWVPIAFFQYISSISFRAKVLVAEYFIHNPYETNISFWNKKGMSLWQWSERWSIMIESLPKCYDRFKKIVMHIEMADFHPFSINTLLLNRAYGGIDYKQVKKYSKFIKKVTNTKLITCYFIALMPKFLIKYKVNNPQSIVIRFSKYIFRKIKYLFIKEKINDNKLISTFENIEKRKTYDNIHFDDKKICIVIPTANRYTLIKNTLEYLNEKLIEYNIDLIIYDSSTNNIIEEKIKNFNNKHLIYLKYNGEYDRLSIDNKVIEIYKKMANIYEYIWIIRDRIIIDLDEVVFDLNNYFTKGMDLIAVHEKFADYYSVGNKIYYSNKEFFKEQFIQMTVLGQTIVKSSFILETIKNYPLDKEKNYSLWQPVAFFYQLLNDKYKMCSYCKHVFYYQDVEKASFWYAHHLWQWGERFGKMLELLPNEYKSENKYVIDEFNKHFNLFSIKACLLARSMGGINKRNVKEYKYYLKQVAYIDYWKLKIIAIMPKKVAKYLFDIYEGKEYRFIKNIYFLFKPLIKKIFK